VPRRPQALPRGRASVLLVEHFLSKAFTPADLAHKVREVLGVTDDLD
jgi:hypothetical protein